MTDDAQRDLVLLAWAMCHALTALTQDVVEHESMAGERWSSWNPALRAHDAFVGWACEHDAIDDEDSDVATEAAVQRWVNA